MCQPGVRRLLPALDDHFHQEYSVKRRRLRLPREVVQLYYDRKELQEKLRYSSAENLFVQGTPHLLVRSVLV